MRLQIFKQRKSYQLYDDTWLVIKYKAGGTSLRRDRKHGNFMQSVARLKLLKTLF